MSAANYFEGLVGSRSTLFERQPETFELFPFESHPGAEFEATAGDDIDRRDILGEAYGVVKGHREHSGYDADPIGAGGDRRGCWQDGGTMKWCSDNRQTRCSESAERNRSNHRGFFLNRHKMRKAGCICVSGAQHVDADVTPLEVD